MWFHDVGEAFAAARGGGESRIAPLALSFLSLHSGHEMWVECELGVLRISTGKVPSGARARLPAFARSCS